MSTDPLLPTGTYRLGDDVVLRPEPPGALVYSHRLRTLTVLRDGDLAAGVQAVDRGLTPAEACAGLGLDPRKQRAVGRALRHLIASGVLVHD